jgi:hypothetical protein
VDADERQIEWWAPEAARPVIEQQHVAWHPAGATRPLTIELGELFRPI